MQPVSKKGARKMAFDRWLDNLGLSDKRNYPDVSDEEKARLQNSALEKSRKIIQLDKRRHRASS